MFAVHFRLAVFAATTGLLVLSVGTASAQKKYEAGASDTEIKIGNIMPYSGSASSYSVVGRFQAAYIDKINANGGVNGRKITFLSYDDSYSPPKAVEQARKLIESDEVLFIAFPLGTASNSAIQKYMNAKKVPQLFIGSGAAKWNNPKSYPWSIGWQLNYQSEGRAFAGYILKEKPDAKIAVLYQNDDLGKDYLIGLKEGLGAKAASMIVGEESYELSEPTIDNHIVKLKSTNADVLFEAATPKFAAQGIKKVAEIGWRPMHIIANVANSVAATIKPAGFDNAQGVITAAFFKDVSDPDWQNDPGMKEFLSFMEKDYPQGNKFDSLNVLGFGMVQTMIQVIKQCGDDLTRENVMRQAANLKDFRTEMLLPGIKINTTPTDYTPISQLTLMRFKGERWERFGDVMSGADANN